MALIINEEQQMLKTSTKEFLDLKYGDGTEINKVEENKLVEEIKPQASFFKTYTLTNIINEIKGRLKNN